MDNPIFKGDPHSHLLPEIGTVKICILSKYQSNEGVGKWH